MPYFLSQENLRIGKQLEISGEEAGHILLSRRAKVGDFIKVQGPDGKRFGAIIKTIGRQSLLLEARDEIKAPKEPANKIILLQSVVANEALETILKKATELMASEVVLFNSQYTATKLTADKFKQKLERWQKLVWESAKQCERAKPPAISFLENLEGVLTQSQSLDCLLVFDITGAPNLALSSNISALGVLIGPEGGLSEDELNELRALPNVKMAKVGPVLLKADTAATAALALSRHFLAN